MSIFSNNKPEETQPEAQPTKPVQQTSLNITHEQLQVLLREAVAGASRLNPLEQKKLNEEIEREKRRNLSGALIGYEDEKNRWNKQHSCTHSRHEQTGNAVPKGTGQYTTGGQAVGRDKAILVCLRCSAEWIWMPTPNERDYIEQHGLLGFAPPPVERCLNKDQFMTEPPKPLDMDSLLGQ